MIDDWIGSKHRRGSCGNVHGAEGAHENGSPVVVGTSWNTCSTWPWPNLQGISNISHWIMRIMRSRIIAMLKCWAHSCFVFAKEEKRLHQAASRVLVVQCRIKNNNSNFSPPLLGWPSFRSLSCSPLAFHGLRFRFAQGGNIVCTAGCVKVWCFHVNLPWSASHSASWGAWTTTSRLGWVRFPMMCVISKRLVHHVHHSTSHQCHVTTSNLLLLRSSWGRSGGRNQDPAIMAPFCSGVVSLFSWTVDLKKSHLAWHGVPPSANSDLWVSLSLSTSCQASGYAMPSPGAHSFKRNIAACVVGVVVLCCHGDFLQCGYCTPESSNVDQQGTIGTILVLYHLRWRGDPPFWPTHRRSLVSQLERLASTGPAAPGSDGWANSGFDSPPGNPNHGRWPFGHFSMGKMMIKKSNHGNHDESWGFWMILVHCFQRNPKMMVALIFHEMIRHEMVGNSKMWTKCRAVLRYVEASDIWNSLHSKRGKHQRWGWHLRLPQLTYT